jgi:hypothetical protein
VPRGAREARLSRKENLMFRVIWICSLVRRSHVPGTALVLMLAFAMASACSDKANQPAPAGSQAPPPAASPAPAAEPQAPAPADQQPPPASEPVDAPHDQAPPAAASTASELSPSAGSSAAPRAVSPAPPRFREITLPAGTELALRLETPVASDASSVEDPVRAVLRHAVVRDTLTVLPAGTPLAGNVTAVERAGKVKGRARVAFRFSALTVDDERYEIATSRVAREARGTKKKDATKVGIGAGAGAIVGGILGGGKGAAIGAGVGAGAGTGVVMSTRGEEVRLAAGTLVTVTLSNPLTIRVPIAR